MEDQGEIFKVITANRLRDGVIVYYVNDGAGAWVEDISAATPFDETSLAGALEKAKASEQACQVVGIYPTEVAARNKPLSARERIRAAGPSVKYGHAAVLPDFSI